MEKLSKKVDGSSSDFIEENIKLLKKVFPEIVNDGSVNLQAMHELFGEVDNNVNERYGFTWPGKSKSKIVSQTPSTGTLRPNKDKSIEFDSAENIFIEGDNLEVLKLLSKSYHKKVKMIYIDPPYNTGNEFVYPDNFQENIETYLKYTGQKDSEGKSFSTNTETNGRFHSNWLNMMYPRIKVARNLLHDEGIIFISIDDSEQHHLRNICDEVFGEENFIACFIWEKRTNRENRKVVSSRHDYLLCYAKSLNKEKRALKQLPMNEKALSNYKNPDNDPRGLWKSDPATAQAGHATKSQFYELKAPNGKIHKLESGRCWLYTEPVMNQAISEGRIWFGKTGDGVPRVKTYLNSKERGLTPETILFAKEATTNEIAKNRLKELFDGKAVFDTPKPVDLIKILIQMTTDKNDIVLDFFAGSCATAHAVVELNKDDGLERKFIMVQLPEICDEKSVAHQEGFGNIAEIGLERIKRVFDLQKEKSKPAGLKYFYLDSSNIKSWAADKSNIEQELFDSINNIKIDRSDLDVVYEILVKYGLELTIPVEVIEINGKKIFSIGYCALIICLEKNISIDDVEQIGTLKEEKAPSSCRVIFRDSSFLNDSVKVNTIQVLKQYGIVDVKTI